MSKNILRRFLNLTEVPKGILFLDEYPVCCRNLIWTMLKSHLNAGRDVHYLCFSMNPEKIPKMFTDGVRGILKIYDLYNDPLQWLSTEKPSVEMTFQELLKLNKSNQVIIIDSITCAVNFMKTIDILRIVQKLKIEKYVVQIIVYCYNDPDQSYLISSLTHLLPASVSLSSEVPLHCSIVWKKKNGQIIKSKEEFSVSSNFELQFCREVKSSKEDGRSQKLDPSIQDIETTFNLLLTDTQREAKNKVVLPHTRIQSNGGEISYVPDEGDDWDDEDPDADLDL